MANALEQQLRAALAAGDFEAARPLALAYGELVRARLRSTASAQERQAIFDAACATLSDNLCLARVVRSHIASRLQSISGQVQYQMLDSQLSGWRLEG